jgi:hypothetical protein
MNRWTHSTLTPRGAGGNHLGQVVPTLRPGINTGIDAHAQGAAGQGVDRPALPRPRLCRTRHGRTLTSTRVTTDVTLARQQRRTCRWGGRDSNPRPRDSRRSGPMRSCARSAGVYRAAAVGSGRVGCCTSLLYNTHRRPACYAAKGSCSQRRRGLGLRRINVDHHLRCLLGSVCDFDTPTLTMCSESRNPLVAFLRAADDPDRRSIGNSCCDL